MDHLGRGIERAVLLICVAVIFTGCTQKTSEEAAAGDATAGADAGLREACAIILAETDASLNESPDIARYRSLLHAQGPRLAYLERLGWAFVEEARRIDESYLYLAERAATCIERTSPGSAEALLLQGHVLHSRHEFAAAERVARRLVALRGRWFDQGLLGDVLVDRGRLDEAIQAYQAMMDQRPGPEAYSRGAVVHWLRGDLDGAIALMRMAVRAVSPRSAVDAAWMRTRLASLLFQADARQEAAVVLASALELRADYAPALALRGRMRLADGRYEEAIEPLERAVAADPLPEHQWLLIDALRMAGRSGEAAARADLLVRTGAGHDPRGLVLYLATVGRDVGRAVELARSEFDKRGDVHTIDALAWALSAAGRLAEARELSLRALAEGTSDPRLFYHAAVIASSVNEDDEAREWAAAAGRQCHLLLPAERAHLNVIFIALGLPEPTDPSRCPAFQQGSHHAPAIAGLSTSP